MSETESKPENGTTATKEPTPFDRMGGTEGLIEISRVTTQGRFSKQIGYCGTVENVEGWKDEVIDRWGGGRYKAEQLGPNGKPTARVFLLPGDSLPIKSHDELEEEDPDDDPPLRFPGAMGYPGGAYPGVGGFPGSYPPPSLPPHLQAQLGRSPVRTEELERLRREVDNLKRDVVDRDREIQRVKEAGAAELQRERDARIKAENDLQRERDRREAEARDASYREQMAEMRATLAALQSRPGDDGNKPLIDLFAQRMASLEQQLTTASQRDVLGEAIKLQKLTGGGKQDIAAQAEALARLSKTFRGMFGDGDGGSDDKPAWLTAIEALGPSALETIERTFSRAPQAQAAGEQQAAGALPAPASQEETVLSMLRNFNALAGEIVRAAKRNRDPRDAVIAVRSLARGMDPSGELEKLLLDHIKGDAASLRDELSQLQVQLTLAPIDKGNIAALAVLLDTEEGAAWANRFIAEVRGG